MTNEQFNCEHDIINLGDDENWYYACVLCGWTQGEQCIAEYMFGTL